MQGSTGGPPGLLFSQLCPVASCTLAIAREIGSPRGPGQRAAPTGGCEKCRLEFAQSISGLVELEAQLAKLLTRGDYRSRGDG